MQKEGQIRIPSGCAIAAVISKEGNKMTGEKNIESMKPMAYLQQGLFPLFWVSTVGLWLLMTD